MEVWSQKDTSDPDNSQSLDNLDYLILSLFEPFV